MRSSSGHSAITCKESVRFVSQLRDNELLVEDAERLELHVSSCHRCQTAQQQFNRLYTSLDVLLARVPINAHQSDNPP